MSDDSERVRAPNLLEMCRGHFNEPVLMGDRVARLIGYGEDDDDAYLIVQYRGGKTSWHTCVGGYHWLASLKGQGFVRTNGGEDWDDFRRVDNLLELNGAPKATEFRLSIDR